MVASASIAEGTCGVNYSAVSVHSKGCTMVAAEGRTNKDACGRNNGLLLNGLGRGGEICSPASQPLREQDTGTLGAQ